LRDDLSGIELNDLPGQLHVGCRAHPCPCGYRNDPRRDCHCTIPQIERYMAKISGPLVDRIDIHIEVPAVDFKELSSESTGTSSEEMREQVHTARRAQSERFSNGAARYNGQMSSRLLRQHCRLDAESMNLLKASVNEMGLSARAHDKILRVARTIADLDAAESIRPPHINEAINYRMLDRGLWK
jgi:magnesium chelatase family protein